MGAPRAVVFAAALVLAGAVMLTTASEDEAAHTSPPRSAPAASTGAAGAAVDWEWLRDVNPDIAAWLEIPGTPVSQPVAVPPEGDPEHYLRHDGTGAPSDFGCPYLDADCEAVLPSHDVGWVLGHNMGRGSDAVFGPVAGYLDPAFASEHETVILHQPGGTTELRVVCALRIDGGEMLKTEPLRTAGELQAWLEALVARADVVVGDVGDAATALGLVTCSYTRSQDERTVVVAVPR